MIKINFLKYSYMPYRRKTARPYRTGKKPYRRRVRKTPSAWSSAKNLATKAWQGYKYLRGMINCEKHFLDTNVAGSVSQSGSISALSALSQGDNINARIGDSILAKYLNIRYTWVMDSTIPTTLCRLMVFQDTMSLGTIPAASDVLEVTGTPPGVVSLLKISNALQGRFKILYDKSVALSAQGPACFITDEIIPINDHIKYTSTAGTDEGRNMLYALFICNVSSNLPSLTLTTRLAYYDN